MDLKDRILGPFTRRWPWLGKVVRVQERFSEVHGTQMAAAVTLNAFLSIFPLLVVAIAGVGWASGAVADLPGEVIERLALKGNAAELVTGAIDAAERSRRAASVVGLLGLLWSGMGLVAALQFAFDSVWQVAGRGLKDKLYGLAWLLGATAILLGSFSLYTVLRLLPGPAAPVLVLGSLAVDTALCLWSFKVLTNRQVGWRAFLPGALLGAVALEALKAVGGVIVPRVVASSSALYGSIGVVFAILIWLLVFGRLVVLAAVVNVVWWEADEGTERAEIELPRVPDAQTAGVTRSGEAEPGA